MAKLLWVKASPSKRIYESGIDQCILFPMDTEGEYPKGIPWSGIVSITEDPSNNKPTSIYANNNKYLNILLVSTFFSGVLEAYSYPDAFAILDGTIAPTFGVKIGQQNRKVFGLSYRTFVGNDDVGEEYGYKIHLVYGILAVPLAKKVSEFRTINETSDPTLFSWGLSTMSLDANKFSPTASLVIDSTKVDPLMLDRLEDILYGVYEQARLPEPEEIVSMFLIGDFGWIVGISVVGIGRVN